jgi:hypothetical protein
MAVQAFDAKAHFTGVDFNPVGLLSPENPRIDFLYIIGLDFGVFWPKVKGKIP